MEKARIEIDAKGWTGLELCTKWEIKLVIQG